MSLIEGFGDEVTVFLCVVAACVVVFLAWISTHTTHIPFFRLVIVNLMNRHAAAARQDNTNTATQGNTRDTSQVSNTDDVIQYRDDNVIAEVDIMSDGALSHNVSNVEFLSHEEADDLIERLDIPQGEDIHVETITREIDDDDGNDDNNPDHPENPDSGSNLDESRGDTDRYVRDMLGGIQTHSTARQSTLHGQRDILDSGDSGLENSNNGHQSANNGHENSTNNSPSNSTESESVSSKNLTHTGVIIPKDTVSGPSTSSQSDLNTPNQNIGAENFIRDMSNGASGFSASDNSSGQTHVLGGSGMGVKEAHEMMLRQRRLAYFDRQNSAEDNKTDVSSSLPENHGKNTSCIGKTSPSENCDNSKKGKSENRGNSGSVDNFNVKSCDKMDDDRGETGKMDSSKGKDGVGNVNRRGGNMDNVEGENSGKTGSANMENKSGVKADNSPSTSVRRRHTQETNRNAQPESAPRGDNHRSDGHGDVGSDGRMKVRLVYLNDTHREVFADPVQTVAEFRQAHFAEEMANNKLVRFIFNGNVLRNDASTLQSYNIRDNSAVHCLITQNLTSHTPHIPDEAPFDLSGLMFPLFALLLTIVWYLRFSYRRYFNTMSTFSLLVITLLFVASYLAPLLDSYSRRRQPQRQRPATR